mmetsp:Transcript_46408/g.137108  ORF Transcript_46408/g.137108 Transcript_46408/m.137108 type:complete len:223 (+) Transcript_46408:271-939(+)
MAVRWLRRGRAAASERACGRARPQHRARRDGRSPRARLRRLARQRHLREVLGRRRARGPRGYSTRRSARAWRDWRPAAAPGRRYGRVVQRQCSESPPLAPLPQEPPPRPPSPPPPPLRSTSPLPGVDLPPELFAESPIEGLKPRAVEPVTTADVEAARLARQVKHEQMREHLKWLVASSPPWPRYIAKAGARGAPPAAGSVRMQSSACGGLGREELACGGLC